MTNKLIFLGYVVSDTGIIVDDKKVKAIREMPVPKNEKKVQVIG